ncbi:hypothetical protein [Streptomyces vastus]
MNALRPDSDIRSFLLGAGLAAKVATGDLVIVGARYELTSQLVHRNS